MATINENALTPNGEEIEQAIRTVRDVTWHDWSDAFEHSGPEPLDQIDHDLVSTNPILADPSRFNRFCWKWSVGRTIRTGKHEEFRCKLRDSRQFVEAIRDGTGHLLSQMETELQGQFGTIGEKGGANSIRSALSKLAAFVRPGRFVAWDQYARRGITHVLGWHGSFVTYADYLDAFDRIWNGPHGERIRKLTGQAPKRPLRPSHDSNGAYWTYI